jgi:hypothetical protein
MSGHYIRGFTVHRIGEIQAIKIFQIVVWISLFLCFNFPVSFKNPENPNKNWLDSKRKSFLFCFDFPFFYFFSIFDFIKILCMLS